MVSYADNFVFGITADYDTAPDIEATHTSTDVPQTAADVIGHALGGC